MKSLRLQVFEQNADNYQLRFFADDSPTPCQTRAVCPKELQQFVNEAKQHYEGGLQIENLGKQLFKWLNGQESSLQNFQKETVLKIPNTHGLHTLAWELLHAEQFLCGNQHKPFTPLRLISEDKQIVEPAKRQLRVLFMASSPEDVKPVLQFEKEEGDILKATQKLPLELVVEESGSLDGLQEWLSYDDESLRFDVVHLTGHAGFNKKKKPVFVLENELGQQHLADANEIAEVFSYKGHFPRLLFLSGCETARSSDSDSDNALPSLAEKLVQEGVPAVLGWAKPVYDFVGTFTAQQLYAYLANGVDLARAVAKTRQDLYQHEEQIQQKTPHYKPQWHLLRFYSDYTPLDALVLKGRAQAKREIRQEFLDKNAKSEVCPREQFVGRRRLLQQALRILRSQQGDAHYADGVLLSGMGGLGKSSLALRICQRLEKLLSKRFVWMGRIDEIALRTVFSEELPEHASTINAVLNQSSSLDLRLKQLFQQFSALENALFVFDDFEQNFIKDNHQQLEAQAYQIIAALLKAIRETGSPSRVLITCRYTFAVAKPLQLAELALNSFDGVELQKKLQALRETYLTPKNVQPISKELEQLQAQLEQQAIELGAGNPRLLDWLYRVLADEKIDKMALFAALEAKQAEFRETLLLQTLLDYQSLETRRLLAKIALFAMPLPIKIFEQALDNTGLVSALQPALALGLIEHYQATLFISRLLVPLLQAELNTAEQQSLYAAVARGLYSLWWESNYRISFEEMTELARIAELGGEKAIFFESAISIASKLQDTYNFSAAKTIYEELLLIAQEMDNKHDMKAILNSLGEIYRVQGSYDVALQHYQNALLIKEHEKHDAVILNNISQIYGAKCDYKLARLYLEQSLEKIQQHNDTFGKATVLNNLASIEKEQGNDKTAQQYLHQSLSIEECNNNKRNYAVILNNIATLNHKNKNYEDAFTNLNKAIEIQEKINDIGGLCLTLLNQGTIYIEIGSFKVGLSILAKSYVLARKSSNIQVLQKLNELAQILEEDGLNFWEMLSQQLSES